MPSYSKKHIKYVITLGDRTFSSTGENTIELVGYRSSCSIDHSGGQQLSTANIRIYGVAQSDMNDATTLLYNLQEKNKTTVKVFALDDSGTYETLIFSGDAVQSWGVYQSQPNVFLFISAMNNHYNLLTPYPVTSYKGATKVSEVIEKISSQLGLHFKNEGVEAVLNNVYLTNTAISQIRQIVHAANIDIYFDESSVIICNKGVPRVGDEILINESSGMIGYPTFDNLGVTVEILFNPFLIFGGKIKVESDLVRANGEFTASSISHNLQSETPMGNFLA